MTTFQAVIYAIVSGISEFLPISAKAHQILVPYLIGWEQPSGALLGALSLGSFLAVMVFFRHDWASMISCFLQVIIFRKRPMTLDERLPMFLAASSLPLAVASYYFKDYPFEIEWSPVKVALGFAAMGFPLWFFDYFNRKIKGMFDWKWMDAFIVGIFQAAAVFPGWDHVGGILLGAFFLNYKREPAAKYAYFASAPILLARVIIQLRDVSFSAPSPMPELSWLSFSVALVVTFLAGLLAIGGFLKHVQQRGITQYIIYRWILAGGTCLAFWYRGH